jgi:hypothetical protein
MKVVVWVLAIPAVQGCGSKVAPSASPASPTTTAVGSATSTHVEETPRAEATVIFETDQGRRKASFVSREPPRVEGGLYWLRLKAQDGSFLVVGINGFAEGPFVCNSESVRHQLILGISAPEMFWSDATVGKAHGGCFGRVSRRENGDATISISAALVSKDSAFVINEGTILVRNPPSQFFDRSTTSRPTDLR